MAKILIIDDSPDVLQLFEVIMRFNKHQSILVSNLEDLDSILNSSTPELILIDVVFRNIDGRELCKAIKQRPDTKDIPVILMSANTNKLKDYTHYFADDILEKPFELNSLLSKIKAIIDKKEANVNPFRG